MKKVSRYLSVICLLLPLFSFATTTNRNFDTIVTFGDSLSDNGNLYKYLLHFLPASPPYYEGHFTNGNVWLEDVYASYFPKDYKIGFQDYAVGGAGAVLSYKENLPFTLSAEVNDYFYWNTYGKKDTTLFAVLIGGNNYLNGPTNVEEITTSATDAIEDAVERLIASGGNKFLIANVPELGKLPQALEAGAKKSALLSKLSKLHNKKLTDKIIKIQKKHPETTIIYFNVDKVFNEVLNSPNSFGLNNTTDACYLGSYSGWFAPQAMLNPDDSQLKIYLDKQLKYQGLMSMSTEQKQALIKNPVLREALRVGYTDSLAKKNSALLDKPLNCDNFLFWDHVHPTKKTHQILANRAKILIDSAGLKAFIPDS